MACKWQPDHLSPHRVYLVQLPATKSATKNQSIVSFRLAIVRSIQILGWKSFAFWLHTYRIVQFLIGDFSDCAGQWTIVNDCYFAAVSGNHMTIDGIVAGIQIATDIPFGEWWITVVQHFFKWFIPMHHVLSDNAPKLFRLLNRTQILIRIYWICARRHAIYTKRGRNAKRRRKTLTE